MKLQTEVIQPLEFNLFEPLQDAAPLTFDKRVHLNDSPVNPVRSVCNESKPLMMVSYLPTSFGQMVYGVQKIN